MGSRVWTSGGWIENGVTAAPPDAPPFDVEVLEAWIGSDVRRAQRVWVAEMGRSDGPRDAVRGFVLAVAG